MMASWAHTHTLTFIIQAYKLDMIDQQSLSTNFQVKKASKKNETKGKRGYRNWVKKSH